MANIEEKVIDIIADHTGADKATITRDTHMANDLGLDSLDYAELMIVFEDEFSINIEDTEAQNITSVGQLIDYVQTASGNK